MYTRSSRPSTQRSRAVEDPRISKTREAVLAAARQLLASSGQDAITHLRVAAAAKVMRATVYRHWPTREALLLSTALSTDMTPPIPPDDLDLRSRLLAFLERLRSDLAGNMVPLLAMLVERGERDAELRAQKRDLTRRALGPVVEVLEAARAEGLLAESAGAELATAQLVGPLFFRRLLSDEPLTSELVEQVVDAFLAAHGVDAQAS